MINRRVFHVLPNRNGWEIRKEGAGTIGIFPSRERAVERAKTEAFRSFYSALKIHRQDYSIEEELLYGEPWE